MPLLDYLPLVLIAAFFSAAAYRLAALKGMGRKRWLMATLLFGPLTLVPLILSKRRSAPPA